MIEAAFVRDEPIPGGAPAARRLLCIVDGPGATWRISFERPLRESRSAGALSLTVLGERSIPSGSRSQTRSALAKLLDETDPTVVILSRCGTAAGAFALRAAVERGLPTIYHIDDDLFAVPAELGRAKVEMYSSAARRHAMHESCRLADLVYCSTPRLRQRIARFGFPTPLIAGDIYCSASGDLAPRERAWPPVIGYMGTSGHGADLEMVVPALELILSDWPTARFEVFGSLKLPEALVRRFPDRVRHVPPTDDYDGFLGVLASLGWSAGLAPLSAIPFNSVKANTKFVEYTAAGIPTVATRGAVYGAIIAAGAAAGAASRLDWAQHIHRLLADPQAAERQLERSRDWLHRHAGHEAHAEQVLRVIAEAERLAAVRHWRTPIDDRQGAGIDESG